jgi:hypothetical protein
MQAIPSFQAGIMRAVDDRKRPGGLTGKMSIVRCWTFHLVVVLASCN